MVMRQVTFKSNCKIKKLTKAMIWMFTCLDKIQNMYEWIPDLVVTSLDDSGHAPTSRHYMGEALDLRTHYFKTKDDRNNFIKILEMLLNEDGDAMRANGFTVLLENEGTDNEHIHMQVKKGQTYP